VDLARDQCSVTDTRWSDRPLSEVIEHVITAFHAVTPGLFARAEAELRILAGAAATAALAELAALRDEHTAHMAKEEAVLFPWILSPRARTAAAPIRAMQLEHGDALARLDELRRLADAALGDVRSPRLDELERSLRDHIRLEDEILFPRALVGT
jgi:iron-sulfur cluster repair protein YtfE (RIC family)